MPRHAQSYCTFSLLASVILTTACSNAAPFWKKDREPQAQTDAPVVRPNTYHEWAHDAPQFVKPAQEPTPAPSAEPGDPQHYFTREKVVMVRRPDGYTLEETPRVAVWWTDNNGFHWNKAGYFGREQSFFPFQVDGDGDYGIRFVGPGQEPSLHAAPLPERVYHVDTSPPSVEVAITPEQSWYHVGDIVTIAWKSDDYHLTEFPVRVGMLTDFTGDEQNPVELQRDLADEGSITYTLAADSLDHEIRFRVDAVDRAGNLGLDISFPLQVVTLTPDEELAGDPTMDTSIASTPENSTDPSCVLPERPATLSMIDDGSTHGAPRLSARIDTTIPFATAIARTAELEPVILDPPSESPDPPADDSPIAAEGSFAIPDSLTSLQGTSVSPNEESNVQSNEASTVQIAMAPAQVPDVTITVAPVKESTVTIPSPTDPPAESDLLSFTMAMPAPSSDLLVPMPATVEKPDEVIQLASAHPWRSLSAALPSALQTIWNLPRPNFTPELNRLFDIGTLADGAWARPVAEPPALMRTAVGLPSED